MKPNVIHVAFHSVREAQGAGFGDPWCRPDRLKAILEFLLSDKREIMLCGEFAECDATDLDPQKKYATISFDDGYKDNITVAAPILTQYGVKATFFIITSVLKGVLPLPGRIKILLSKFAPDITPDEEGEFHRRLNSFFKWVAGHSQSGDKIFGDFCHEHGFSEYEVARQQYLSPVDIRDLVKIGMEIGSHTVTHPMLTNIPIRDAGWEIMTSAADVNVIIKERPKSFSWPYGMWESPAQKSMLFDLVRSWKYTSGWGYHRMPMLVTEHPRWAIARIDEAAFEEALGIPPLL